MSGKAPTERLSFVRVSVPARIATLDSTPMPAELDLARTALVVIDMQNDFLHPDGWFARSGLDPTPLLTIVPVIRRLAAGLRSAGLPVIWLNWGVRADVANIPSASLQKAGLCGRRATYGDPSPSGQGHVLVQGEWGARTIDELAPEAGDLLIHKHRLTGFHDNEFESVLRARGIETLLFAGINTDRCVFTTLTDAATRGFGCVLVEDACATGSSETISQSILALVRLLHGVTATSDAVLAALQGAAGSSP